MPLGAGEWQVPHVTESASMDEKGAVTITLNNLSAQEACQVEVHLTDREVKRAEGEILSSCYTDYNTFEHPDQVKSCPYTDYEIRDGRLILNLPASSVLCVTVTA